MVTIKNNHFTVPNLKCTEIVFWVYGKKMLLWHFSIFFKYLQYMRRPKTSFQLTTATICPQALLVWCSDLALENALWGENGEKYAKG